MHCYPGKQLAHQKFPHKFCTSSWQSVGYVDIFHAVFWQPRISSAPEELSFSSFFQSSLLETTFIHFPELPYSRWQLKFVYGNKMWICSNNPSPLKLIKSVGSETSRSRWAGACNSHTRPLSRHFYRLIYLISFSFVKERQFRSSNAVTSISVLSGYGISTGVSFKVDSI